MIKKTAYVIEYIDGTLILEYLSDRERMSLRMRKHYNLIKYVHSYQSLVSTNDPKLQYITKPQ